MPDQTGARQPAQQPAQQPALQPALQRALQREHYVDPAVHLRELGQVWAHEWVCAGRACELGIGAPRTVATVTIAGESVLLTRDGDGQLHALANVCRHRGSQLVPHAPELPSSCAAATVLRCPYHSWTYDLDGALRRAPHADGLAGFERSEFGLHRLDVAEWAGFTFVRHESRAQHTSPSVLESPARHSSSSLLESLGGIAGRVARYPLAELVSARWISYQVAANWKVLAENYNECYHCAGVHPELTRLVPDFGHGGLAPDGSPLDWSGGIPHREGAWTFSFSGGSPRPPFTGLDDAERLRHKGELVYPNLLLSLAAEHVAAFVLTPLAVDRTRVDFDVLIAPDQLGTDVEDCAGFWDLVNQQDWAICESVQRGMTSRHYRQGWYAPMEDDSLDIRRWLLPRLEGPTDAAGQS